MVEERFRVKLEESDIRELRRMEGLIRDIKRELARAKEAGIDVAEMEADLKVAEERIKGILRVYGGGK